MCVRNVGDEVADNVGNVIVIWCELVDQTAGVLTNVKQRTQCNCLYGYSSASRLAIVITNKVATRQTVWQAPIALWIS